MASLPQSSQPNASSASHDQLDAQDVPSSQDASPPPASSTPSMTSEDSQTVLLNTPSTKDKPENARGDTATPRPSMPSRSSTMGIKKCWICICDSTEDDLVDMPVWRSPCTCNLTAHESCLLDWVADLENPKNRKRNPPPTKILCPQCKSEIKIARPRSYVVDGLRTMDRSLGRLVLPGLALSVMGTMWAGLFIHGFQSVWIVFGRTHAIQIFREAQHHHGWLAGYPLIPLSLIFSRTSYADFVLPGGSLFLLATQLSDRFEIDMTIWPPLPSTVFACLPALRTVYNFAYEKAFGELNRKWIQEVQPRQNERTEGQENNPADVANADEELLEEIENGGLVLQLEVNIGANEEEAPQDNPAPENNAGAPIEGAAGEGAAADGNQAGVANQILGPRQDEIVEGTSGIGQTVLGALLFPAVSTGMGGLLSYALPIDWISGSSNWMNGRPGLFRHRWGRTVVGGCLFVVLKDALVLYCRWRLAQTHRQRKIMNYDKTTKEYKLASP